MNVVRLRYSLCALLFLTACAALFVYWFSRPSQFAHYFVEAIESKNFDAADDLFVHSQHRFIAKTMHRDQRSRFHANARAQTLAEWLKGAAELTVVVEEVQIGFGKTTHYTIVATPRGLQEPIPFEAIPGGTL